MAKEDYATKEEIQQIRRHLSDHLVEAEEGFSRLASVEAELMGDERTGRPSLRSELTGQMNFIKRIAITILVALIIGILGNWLGIGAKNGAKADPQIQAK